MPILICAQNIQSLTFDFPFDSEEDEASNTKMLESLSEMNNNDKKAKAIEFP